MIIWDAKIPDEIRISDDDLEELIDRLDEVFDDWKLMTLTSEEYKRCKK